MLPSQVFERVLMHAAAPLGRFPLEALLGSALEGQSLALCLHRIDCSAPRSMSIARSEMDALIDVLVSSQPRAAPGWLTLSFDDGYDDAARYVLNRARRWPELEWLFFVCPRRNER